MTASLLILPGVVIAAFAMLFATTVLERLIGPPGADRPTLLPSAFAFVPVGAVTNGRKATSIDRIDGENPRRAPSEAHNEQEGAPWASP